MGRKPHRKRTHLINWVDPEDESALAVRDVSSILGFPEDLVSSLTVEFLGSSTPISGSIAELREWLFSWMRNNPDQTLRILRTEDLERQFGSKYQKLPTESARLHYALPKLKKALELWMSGKPLTSIESSLKGTNADRKKSSSARKFVIRLVPMIAHAFAAPALIFRRHWTDPNRDPQDVAPSLFALTHCVRNGFSSLEMYALYDNLLRTPNRRQIHRHFERISPRIKPTTPNGETWLETKGRVAAAEIST